MLLGKRPRPPIMRRTTSMSGGMAVEDSHEEQVLMSEDNSLHLQVHDEQGDAIKDPPCHDGMLAADRTKDVLVGMVMSSSPNSPNNHLQNHTTNNPSHVLHTPHFLRTCGLCQCHLAPGRDIYMYRGDTAFCSLECREKQMKQDKRKEKWKLGSNKEEHRAPPLTATAKASTKSETAAACT